MPAAERSLSPETLGAGEVNFGVYFNVMVRKEPEFTGSQGSKPCGLP